MALGRPKTQDPRIHAHATRLTDAEEAVWAEALRRLAGGGPLLPRDSDAVRLALRRLAESVGLTWPAEQQETGAAQAQMETPSVGVAARPSKREQGKRGRR